MGLLHTNLVISWITRLRIQETDCKPSSQFDFFLSSVMIHSKDNGEKCFFSFLSCLPFLLGQMWPRWSGAALIHLPHEICSMLLIGHHSPKLRVVENQNWKGTLDITYTEYELWTLSHVIWHFLFCLFVLQIIIDFKMRPLCLSS